MSISWDERGETPMSSGTPVSSGAVRGAWLTPRRVMLIFAAAVALVAIAIAARLTQTLATKKTVTNRVTPAVTVTEAGRSAAPTTVSITGTIGARYDTPIGAEGDAGRVSAVYVEAGDHVKRGQVLARIDTSVLVPQVANLQAALDLARAESELAAAEYQRAVAVGKSGALSTEETERRRSSSVTACQGQGGRGAARGGAGTPGARRGARARRRRHPHPHGRGGTDREPCRQPLVPHGRGRRSGVARRCRRDGLA